MGKFVEQIAETITEPADNSMSDTPKIVIAGCGPGHTDYITSAVYDAVAEAEVLVGARHLLELFAESPAIRIPVGTDIQAALDNMTNYRKRHIVVLVSGDTGLFSLARSVQKRVGRQQCQLIPGISSVQLACARLGLDWNDLRILSAHGRSPQAKLDELKNWQQIAILTGTSQATNWAADLLEQLGSDYVAMACEDLSWDSEQIRQFDADGLRNNKLASRTIVLLLHKEVLT